MQLINYEVLKKICDDYGLVMTCKAVAVLETFLILNAQHASSRESDTPAFITDYGYSILSGCNQKTISIRALNNHIEAILKMTVKMNMLMRVKKITGGIMTIICREYFNNLQKGQLKTVAVETNHRLSRMHEKELHSIQSLLKHIMEADQ